MPWGFPFFRNRTENQNQKKKEKGSSSSSSKSPKNANKPISASSTNRITKPRASSTGNLEKSTKSASTTLQKAIDSAGSSKSVPITNPYASRLFGTDPSNLTSFNYQRPNPAITLSPSELAIRKRDQRLAALAQRKAQEEHDNKLRLASRRRVDPTVTPHSDAFQTILYSIRTHLDSPTSTLNELLKSRFSPEDRDLLLPADWEQNPVLAELQGKNSERYKRLVKGEVKGWQKRSKEGSKGDSNKKGKKADNEGWAKEADLAFKLTCLYFGLPVAPMGWEQSETRGWWEKKQLSGGGGKSERGYGGPGYDEEEDDMGNIVRRPREDPIKFLNCYGKRYFEKDAVREPDPVLETYNALPQFPMTLRELDPEGDYINADALRVAMPDKFDFSIGLRGGGDFDDEDEEDEDEEHSMDVDEPVELVPSPENALVSLRGGGPLKDIGHVFKDIDRGKHRISTEAYLAFAQTDHHKVGLRSRLAGERGGVENLWIPLYGYQGIVWFRIDMLNTFVDAVDRLLGFGVRAGASYKLYVFDRNKEYKTRAQKEAFLRNDRNHLDVACKGPGDYSNDHIAWNWVIGHLGSLGNDTTGSPLAHQKVLFVAGPSDPVPYQWEPTNIHNVAKLVLEWDGMPDMNRPDVAYLRMPIVGDPSAADVHTNQFAPWMTQACRVLCAGRIPNRPGQPLVPDAYIGVKVTSDPRGGGNNNAYGTYGGLTFNFNQWTSILQAHKDARDQPIVLRAWTSESPSGNIDRWHLFVPGVSYMYSDDCTILHSEFKDSKLVHAKIRNMLESGLGREQLQDLKHIEVHLPGESFLADAREQSEVLIPVDTTGKLDKQGVQRFAELLQQWHNWLKEKPGVPPAKHGVDMFPQFITLQPVYWDYALVCDEDPEQMLEWNPRETSLAEFRRLIEELWSPGRYSVDYYAESSRVRLTQNELDGAPMLVVLPTTTELEWYKIRDMVVWPELVVQVYDDQFDVFGDIFAQPFGYRDIYKTDANLLYSSLSNKDDLPNGSSLRFGRDYQLWAEQVPWSHGELRTIQPSDHQLQPAPGATASQQSRTPQTAVNQHNPNPMGFASNLPPPRPTHTGVFSASRKLDLDAMNPSEKGRFLREFSYANPLTVDFVKGIPVHIPPIDQLLDCKFDNTPRLANGVLTPSEVRLLQQKYFEMRTILLEREEKCHFPGCDAAFPYGSGLIARHIKAAHTAEKCNFCHDPLYQHWTVAQRFQHFASKHADILGALQTSRPINAASSNDHPNPFQFQRELSWSFCCRCGRDHSVLASKLDRFHHDLVCYPGAAHHEIHPWKACTVCGERIHTDDPSSAKAHKHPDVARGPGIKPDFCAQCGLELRKLEIADREKHAHFCRGHCGGKGHTSSSFNVRFCPWCGLEMEMTTSADGTKVIDALAAQRHIDSCVAKPQDDKRTFGPIHPVSRLAYYYGIPKGAKTARVDVPQGVIPLKQWLGRSAATGGRQPLRAKKGERVGPAGATDLTMGTVVPAGFFGDVTQGGPGPATAAAKTAAKKARFADVVEEVEPEEEEDEDEEMSDLSIVSEDEPAGKKAGKRPARATGGKRKRPPFTSDDPTYKPTWKWDSSDHSSEFMSDDESAPRPSAAKKAKTAAEPEVKTRKVSFRPTGKGGKKKLAPFQSEDPSYRPPKNHSDESDLSDVAADPLDISLWPQPHEVVKFPGDDVVDESEDEEPEEEEEEEREPTPSLPGTKDATAKPPRPAKTLALTAAAQKAAAKAAAAAQGSFVEKIILQAPPKILPTIHGIREPNSDATTSSSEDEEASDEEPKKGKGKGAAKKKAAPKKAAARGGVTTRGKAKQADAVDDADEPEEEEDVVEEEEEGEGGEEEEEEGEGGEEEEEEGEEAQSPVSATALEDQDADEQEGPPTNPLPALKAAKVMVLRAPDSPTATTSTRSRGLNAKMMQLPSGSGGNSSPSKLRSRSRGHGHGGNRHPKVSLSPNPRLFGKGTSPDPLQPPQPPQSPLPLPLPQTHSRSRYRSRSNSHTKKRSLRRQQGKKEDIEKEFERVQESQLKAARRARELQQLQQPEVMDVKHKVEEEREKEEEEEEEEESESEDLNWTTFAEREIEDRLHDRRVQKRKLQQEEEEKEKEERRRAKERALMGRLRGQEGWEARESVRDESVREEKRKPPGRVTEEDLAALARSYPGPIA